MTNLANSLFDEINYHFQMDELRFYILTKNPDKVESILSADDLHEAPSFNPQT